MSLGVCEAHTPRLTCVSKRDGGGFPSSLSLSLCNFGREGPAVLRGVCHTPLGWGVCIKKLRDGGEFPSSLCFSVTLGERVLQSPKIV